MKLNCIAIDDEPLALDIIEDYIKQVDYLDYHGGFDNPLQALNYLKTVTIDLVFLDIHMNKLNGLQMIKVMNTKPLIVLTTAYDKYALTAFEMDVVDYLLKPISFERFILSVNKAYEKFRLLKNKPANEQAIIANPRENYLFVKSGSKLVKIEFDQILYIEGMSEYLKIVTEKGDILSLLNFTNLSKALPEKKFVRVHKSYLVSIQKIDSIERNRILIKNKLIPISDTYRERFYEILDNHQL